MRLIDADELLKLYEEGNGRLSLDILNIPIPAVRQSIRDMPTVETVEVTRKQGKGRWYDAYYSEFEQARIYRCTECGQEICM